DPGRGGGSEVESPRREAHVRVVIVVQGQRDLLEVVGALRASGGLAHLLDSGEQQADEDRDDRDHHQQLDQRESFPDEPAHGYLPVENRVRGGRERGEGRYRRRSPAPRNRADRSITRQLDRGIGPRQDTGSRSLTWYS